MFPASFVSNILHEYSIRITEKRSEMKAIKKRAIFSDPDLEIYSNLRAYFFAGNEILFVVFEE